MRKSGIKGHFLRLRDIERKDYEATREPCLFFWIHRLVRLFFRVLTPSAGFPHGVDG